MIQSIPHDLLCEKTHRQTKREVYETPIGVHDTKVKEEKQPVTKKARPSYVWHALVDLAVALGSGNARKI